MKRLTIPLTMLAATLLHASAGAATSSHFSALDLQTLHEQEVLNEKKGEAPRFAIAHKVSISPNQIQSFDKSGKYLVWTHLVKATNAVSLNFGFTQFNLPVGATLSIRSVDGTKFIRTFDANDNNVNNELWTPVIMSNNVMIVLTLPAHKISELKFELGHVGQGFRTFSDKTLRSGSCNVDVACSDSQGWEKEVNSVAVISTGGDRFCSGFMVNNTANDKTPFFMTANHCQITAKNAASLVTYWNYQSSECNGERDGQLDNFGTGSVFLANNAKTDFTLVKLVKAPKPEWKVSYAGWNANKENAKSITVIHHPNVDEKAISFSKLKTTFTGYGIDSQTSDTSHVRVADYDLGTTEPGSSGSPLFDQNHRVIGQLHGGGAACENDEPDWFGSFSVSWSGGTTPGSRLKDHLDAKNTGLKVVDTIQ